MATTDIGAVAEATKSVADLVKDLADKPHPLIRAWKIFRLERKLVKKCQEFPHVPVEDMVMAATDGIEEHQRKYLVDVVAGELKK